MRTKRWLGGVLLLLAWELVSYLRWVDKARVSHPTAILQTFVEIEFLKRFGEMFVHVAVVALLGGTIGISMAIVIDRSPRLAQGTSRFLRTILWVPFFVLCALPEWPIRTVSLILTMGIIAITFFTCHQLLMTRSALRLEWFAALPEVGRKVILQALFFSLYSEIQRSGWVAQSFERPDIGYVAAIILCLFLVVIDKLFHTNFDHTAELDCKVLTSVLSNQKVTCFMGAILIGLVCLGFWQLFSDLLARYLLLGSPLDVLKTAYTMLIAGPPSSSVAGRIWQTNDALISLVEIFSGLFVAGGVGLALSSRMSESPDFRAIMLRLLPMTYVAPLVLTLSVSNWIGRAVEAWQTALAVALLSFYPFMKVIRGLRGESTLFRILFGAAEALPFAFVGMFFGELWSASQGLGFYAVLARAELRITEAMAVSLLSFALFVLVSSFLRFIAKSLHFSTARMETDINPIYPLG